jgi:putative hydrolase of the HAD superfamily
MKEQITTLFLDIGGVLLTNGWDRKSRRLAMTSFDLEQEETEERHHLIFPLYEEAKLTLDEYLDSVIFHTERNFTREDFKTFMFNQSSPIEGSIEFFKLLKAQHQLKVVAVNNEGQEINEYRIRKYKLGELIDSFISSCYMHIRKPDAEIFNMACNIAHVSPREVLYIDDRHIFVELASKLGIRSYQFTRVNDAKTFMQSVNFLITTKELTAPV